MATDRIMEVDLINYGGIQYYGQLALGNKQEDLEGKVEPVHQSTFVFDTGSSWTWTSSIDCKSGEGLFGGSDCQNSATNFLGFRKYDYYNHKLSKSYKQQIDGQLYPKKLFYGTGSISGFTAQDDIKINDKEIKSFKFLSVHEAKQLKSLHADGIVGLSPQLPDGVQDLRFMDQLKSQGTINDRIFSFYLDASQTYGSKILLGGYNLSSYADLSETLYWHNSRDVQYWSAPLSEVKYGDQTVEIQTSDAILDTGSSFLIVPEQDFNNLTQMIQQESGKSCGIDRFNNNFFYCSCLTASYDDFPDLTISLGGAKADSSPSSEETDVQQYTIPSRSYIDHRNLKCYFKIQKLPETGLYGAQHRMWVLGLTFLENYYTIYDFEEKRIGIIKSKSYGTRQPNEFQNVFYLLAVITLLLSVSYLMFYYIRKLVNNKDEVSERIGSLKRLQKWRSRRHKLWNEIFEDTIDDNVTPGDKQNTSTNDIEEGTTLVKGDEQQQVSNLKRRNNNSGNSKAD